MHIFITYRPYNFIMFCCLIFLFFSCFLVFGHLATSDLGDRHVYVCVHAVRVPQPHRVRLRQRHDGGHQVKLIKSGFESESL